MTRDGTLFTTETRRTDSNTHTHAHTHLFPISLARYMFPAVFRSARAHTRLAPTFLTVFVLRAAAASSNYTPTSMAASTLATSIWGGEPATLLRKVPQVTAEEDRLPVYTLTFSTPPSGLDVRIDHGDVVKVCVPDYKPKSYSCSSQREGEFDITLKVYPGGRASGYLDRVAIGEDIIVFSKGKKRRAPGAFVGLIAYGVGITEALPIAAAELSKSDAEVVHLLWASKTFGDTFWHDQIEELRENFGERFQLTTILSREERAGSLNGRIDASVLAKVYESFDESRREEVRFLSVGTKAMMRSTDDMLAEIGYPMPAHGLLRSDLDSMADCVVC